MAKNYISRKRSISKRVSKKSRKGGSGSKAYKLLKNKAVSAKLQKFLKDYKKFKNLNHDGKIKEIESICKTSTPKLRFYVENIIKDNKNMIDKTNIKNIVLEIKNCLEKNYRSNEEDKENLLESLENYLKN